MHPNYLIAQVNGVALLGGCFGLVLGGVIGVLIGAIILRQATLWVTKITLGYGFACLFVIGTGVVSFVINFILGFGIGFVAAMSHISPEIAQALATGMGLLVGFFLNSAACGLFIKYPDRTPATTILPAGPGGQLDYASTNPLAGKPIGFAKGMLVTLVQYLIILVIVLIIVGLVLMAVAIMK